MSTKKPAISTQLKAAQTRIAELEKKIASEENSKKYYERKAFDSEEELKQLHAFFNALPGCIPEQDKESYHKNSAMTRLAAWLAIR